MKHKSAFVGEMIAFIVCNKPFKPLGFPRGRAKSLEDFSEMIPTNIETLCCRQERIFTHHGSCVISMIKKTNTIININKGSNIKLLINGQLRHHLFSKVKSEVNIQS
jgi:hypothetical protein